MMLQLDSQKKYLISWAIHHAKIPPHVWISVPSGTQIIAKIGDEVKTGQVIGTPKSSDGIYFHASISGQVTAIEFFPHGCRAALAAGGYGNCFRQRYEGH